MCKNVIDTIGNTPLIKLKRASQETGCQIYGKAEFLNPGGSVKDRAALYIIRDAEKKKIIKPGGIVVEERLVTLVLDFVWFQTREDIER